MSSTTGSRARTHARTLVYRGNVRTRFSRATCVIIKPAVYVSSGLRTLVAPCVCNELDHGIISRHIACLCFESRYTEFTESELRALFIVCYFETDLTLAICWKINF